MCSFFDVWFNSCCFCISCLILPVFFVCCFWLIPCFCGKMFLLSFSIWLLNTSRLSDLWIYFNRTLLAARHFVWKKTCPLLRFQCGGVSCIILVSEKVFDIEISSTRYKHSSYMVLYIWANFIATKPHMSHPNMWFGTKESPPKCPDHSGVGIIVICPDTKRWNPSPISGTMDQSSSIFQTQNWIT